MEPLLGPYGSSSLPHIARLAEYGANALWFHGFDPAASRPLRGMILQPASSSRPSGRFAARPELIPMGVDGRPIRYGSLVQGVCLPSRTSWQRLRRICSTACASSARGHLARLPDLCRMVRDACPRPRKAASVQPASRVLREHGHRCCDPEEILKRSSRMDAA